MLDVTLLGTAAMAPLPERALTAAVLRCAGRAILFDCGEGTQTAARRWGVHLMHVDVIALTHYHGDHIFGLPGLLQSLGVQGRTEPLFITGPAGLREALAPVAALAAPLPYALYLLELPGEGVALHELHPGWPERARLRAFATRHRGPSQGYRFTLARAGRFLPERARELGVPVEDWGRLQRGEAVEREGATVAPEQVLGAPRRGLAFAFTGDTAPCASLTEGARGVDLLICEATYGADEDACAANAFGHMTFAQAGEVARAAGVRRLWLAHYSQRVERPADYLAGAQARFPAARCGEDGMYMQLKFED